MKGIFIIGTGRSGTHFTTRVLSGYKNIHDPLKGKEDNRILDDVAKSAIHHRRLSSVTEQSYQDKFCERPKGKIFIDQHHPNLFHISQILEIETDILFLYLDRPVEQIVASMLNHGGIMAWYKYALKNKTTPYPNRFLGLNEKQDIRSLPPHILCAHRVASHLKTLDKMRKIFPDKIRMVRYVDLVETPQDTLKSVFTPAEKRKLGAFILKEKPEISSLDKFRDTLTAEQVKDINAICNIQK